MNTFTAAEAVEATALRLRGLPVFIAGSSAVAAYDASIRDDAYDDIDVWCPSPEALMSAASVLMFSRHKLTSRSRKLWEEWMMDGMSRSWETHSIKLDADDGFEVNLIVKSYKRAHTKSLSQVLELFDFGQLAVGVECQTGEWRDLRPYLFPTVTPGGPYPLLPFRRDRIAKGIFGHYQGIRQVTRYAKYYNYGYDLSLVKPDLVSGYWGAAEFWGDRDKDEHKTLGLIYEALARAIEDDDVDKLTEVGNDLVHLDSFDLMLDALK